MNRRHLLGSSAALAAAAAQTPSSAKRTLIELRYFQLRNSADNQMQRVTDLLQNTFLPAAKRAGVKTAGLPPRHRAQRAVPSHGARVRELRRHGQNQRRR